MVQHAYFLHEPHLPGEQSSWTPSEFSFASSQCESMPTSEPGFSAPLLCAHALGSLEDRNSWSHRWPAQGAHLAAHCVTNLSTAQKKVLKGEDEQQNLGSLGALVLQPARSWGLWISFTTSKQPKCCNFSISRSQESGYLQSTNEVIFQFRKLFFR